MKMDPLICIDFGNSYTKVAFRNKQEVVCKPGIFGMVPRRKHAQALPVRDDGLTFDEHSVVIPTAVAFTQHGQNPRWYCGSELDQISSDIRNDPSTVVFRNWKPRFFGTPKNDAIFEPPSPVIAVDLYAEYRQWRRLYRDTGSSPEYVLSFEQWQAVRGSFAGSAPTGGGDTTESQYWSWEDRYIERNGDPHYLIGFKQWEAARKAFAALKSTPSKRVPPGAIAQPIEDAELDKIAVKFFSWLYGFVQDSVREQGIDLRQTPTRITLPGFGNIAGATERLKNVLSLAGWRCSDVLPVLSEPVANAVGFFTRGLSVIAQPPHSPVWDMSYRGMLEHTALFGALQNHAQDIYKVLTIDIGGYTTDFALTGFNSDVDADRLFPDPSQRSENFDWTSEVGGVQDIDERLASRLSADKNTHFRKMMTDTRQTRLEEFHRSIYGKLGRTFFQLPVPELRIAEDSEEQTMVTEVLEQFASHVCQWADNFAARCGSIDEVVLTGGGFSIPTIRNKVAHSLLKWNPKYIIAPHDEGEGDDDFIPGYDGDKVDFAPTLLNRCSTAYGGTSILFG